MTGRSWDSENDTWAVGQRECMTLAWSRLDFISCKSQETLAFSTLGVVGNEAPTGKEVTWWEPSHGKFE